MPGAGAGDGHRDGGDVAGGGGVPDQNLFARKRNFEVIEIFACRGIFEAGYVERSALALYVGLEINEAAGGFAGGVSEQKAAGGVPELCAAAEWRRGGAERGA